ncbi:SMAD/FHA domain-containing protein [Coniochaeta sp. 2T2.1]|nr:SMAD/FHA domain-containing protein [Coniochaeta sp. 2T2.1]
MGSDYSEDDHRSKRQKHADRDEDGEVSSSRKRRPREDDDEDRPRRRHRSRSTSRRREKRDRSRSPDSTRRRSRDRRRDRDVDETRHKHRHRRSRSRDRDSKEKEGSRRHRSRSADGSSKDKDHSRRHRSSRSPTDSSRRHRHRHRSPSPKAIDYPSSRLATDSARERRHRDSPTAKAAVIKRSGPLPSQDADFAVSTGLEPEPEVEKPNFKPTGALAAAANAVTTSNGETVTLKYHEPPEARKPSPRDKWKMFVFKGADVVDTIELSLRSCWLVGRDRAVVDLPAEHPSISKQHAVVQFRYTEKRNEFGDKLGKVKPYLIDLESANGTVLNGDKVPGARYLEVRNKDVIKFGLSEREYVVMLDRE